MNYLDQLFPAGFTAALSHMLLHSLWQGVILAVITGLILVFTRRATAAKRYQLMIAVLMLFALTTAATFIWEINQGSSRSATVGVNAPQETSLVFQTTSPTGITQGSWVDAGINYFNSHTQVIALVWFLAVLARSLQLLTGLQGLYYLRRRSLVKVGEYWEQRVAQLAQRLGIKQIIGIAESGLAKVPMVIGHLKPLILIPAGLLTALPPAEIEAILVHELAHIRRRDYLVNLLQSLIEIIFFFNPAVLWLSALIRTERENCCDDIAVNQTSSKMNYIRALVSCQEYQLSAPAYAMAFPGRHDKLVDRVKRMVSGRNHTLNVRERSVLAIVLLSAGLLSIAFTNAKKIDRVLGLNRQSVHHTVKVAEQGLLHLSQAAKKQDPIKALQAIQATANKMNSSLVTDTTAKTKVPGKLRGIASSHNGGLDTLKGNLGKLSGRPAQQGAIAGPDSTGQAQKLGGIKLGLSPLSATAQPNGYNNIYKSGYNAAQAAYKSNPYGNQYKQPYQPDKEPSVDDKVTAELIKDGLVDGRDKQFSFKLSQLEMIIDGVKQPDDVFQRYKQKFVPATGKNQWTLYHNYDTDTKVTTKQ
ncbi:M56 family metallopeptidase [Mucilaginibacter dorajii]|uniref:Peptidase M56 domain-containing protein n=1 Tax=Mucilaginibacter dorajii TaxID=692994 RepID=A0ABP7QR58_9SPHI|nr:M56 family metallopeptidase [Mucilaginibacter dorajii]MCS3733961.1 beta-lactamase regulating signal transducer with metallopeptidase domain [Mucilaginibacter dorajii]